MIPKADPDSLGLLVTETARLLRNEFERRIATAGLGLTPGEARALIYVSVTEGARQTVIAERMGVEPMTVCSYLDRLEKLDLVARGPDPVDRRAKNVRTTDRADAVIAAIRRQTGAIYEEIQAGLDDTERKVLLKALKVLRGNLQATSGRPAAMAMQGDEVEA